MGASDDVIAPANGRRPKGEVRLGLIEAGLELARCGGPQAVVLREAARRVGVVPNAAYRHFDGRDDLLNEVCVRAMGMLARRMQDEVGRVPGARSSKRAARARLNATGTAYLDFARLEPGWFDTVFAVPGHLEYGSGAEGDGEPTPFALLGRALDDLVVAKVLTPQRRPGVEFPVWSAVHGLAVLRNGGPLRELPAEAQQPLDEQVLSFILRAL